MVKGTLDPGEAPQGGAIRELYEEAGVEGLGVAADLGTSALIAEGQVWHFLRFEGERLPESWTHHCLDDGGHDFAFFWHRLDKKPGDEWHAVFHRALAYLRSRVISQTDLDAIVTLDARLLTGHTAEAGEVFDVAGHRRRVTESLEKSRLICVDRDGRHVAHTYFWPLADGRWFVGAFSVDPAHRNASVLAEIGRRMVATMEDEGIETLESHVYRTNALSLAFHEKLGFERFMENEKGFALRIERARLATSALGRRLGGRR
ncbi:hydrolase, NUDIX family [Pelagibacterium halotolerans B2]|uniref:Hydrolase, NUDIX family n=1 Tax=Pelagibacterium halotolerans (strain DSM 22347 / JCM 15775 / CGMCC 1.7692 / B2) TaxID=1082931 RepID=G4RG68_PELHB|nr:hydrolase, NUDIX family [Pelagibacterium halotolerans B2]